MKRLSTQELKHSSVCVCVCVCARARVYVYLNLRVRVCGGGGGGGGGGVGGLSKRVGCELVEDSTPLIQQQMGLTCCPAAQVVKRREAQVPNGFVTPRRTLLQTLAHRQHVFRKHWGKDSN